MNSWIYVIIMLCKYSRLEQTQPSYKSQLESPKVPRSTTKSSPRFIPMPDETDSVRHNRGEIYPDQSNKIIHTNPGDRNLELTSIQVNDVYMIPSPHANKELSLRYVGPIVNGSREGEGKLYDSRDRLIYSGTFENNYLVSGKSYDYDGTVLYDGDFSNLLYHGGGHYYGQTFEKIGKFENGSLVTGLLKMTNHNVEYSGSFKNECLHGYGTEINRGNTFTGEFVDGILQKLSEAEYNDSIVKHISNDIYEISYGNGNVYEGQIKSAYDPVAHGYGKMTHSGIYFGSYHGETYQGYFSDNMKNGIGHSYHNGHTIIQVWQHDKVIDVKTVF